MVTSLADILANLRTDLRDTDAVAYKWNDAELKRFITQAVDEYSQAAPLLDSLTVPALADSMGYDHTTVAGWLYCWRVEYPLEQRPRSFLDFEESQRGKVLLLSSVRPVAGADVRFWYAARHTLNEGSSTIPVEDKNIIAMGAEGYALLSFATYSVGRITPTARDVDNYHQLGLFRLEDFRSRLATLAREGGATIISWADADDAV